MPYNTPARGNGPWFQGIKKESATQKHKLGEFRRLEDGRCFVYCKAGATALGAGKLQVQAATDSNAHNEAIAAAAAIGATELSVTFGGAVTANAYKEGFVHVNDATGEGHIYKVKEHAAGTTAVTVYLEEPVEVALVASTSEITLTKHPCDGVVVLAAATATATGVPVCVPLIPVTASYYFWGQVKGPCPVYTYGTVVAGNVVVPDWTASTGLEGGVRAAAAEADWILGGMVGNVMQVNATTEYSLIMLDIKGF